MSLSKCHKIMLSYAERNPCLLHYNSGGIYNNKDKHWRDLTVLLNSIVPEARRNTAKWKKAWASWKWIVRNKAKRYGVKNLDLLESKLYRLMEIPGQEEGVCSTCKFMKNLNPVVFSKCMCTSHQYRGYNYNVAVVHPRSLVPSVYPNMAQRYCPGNGSPQASITINYNISRYIDALRQVITDQRNLNRLGLVPPPEPFNIVDIFEQQTPWENVVVQPSQNTSTTMQAPPSENSHPKEKIVPKNEN